MPALVEAFYQGDGPTVHSLFDQTACLCSSTTDGCGPLHWLFAFQNEKELDGIVDRLLKTDDGHLAALVNLPFSAPREIHCQWPLKLFGSPLAVAISVNSLITVKALLALGADPFLHIYYEAKPHPEDQGQHWTAFHIAAKYHCSEILQYLVEHSDSGRHAGLSPLGCALSFSTSLERLAMHGLGRMEHLDRTVQIIKSIQSLTAVASNGMTALMQAIDFQDHDVAASLLRAAPELANTPFLSPRDKQVFNLPIHFAAQIASQRDSPDALEIPDLIDSYTQELRASVAPARDHAGRTPLHLASTGSSNRIATWILQRKSNLLRVEDTWGRIPLHYCTSATTCKLLLQQGASVDHTDKFGMTALHRASLDGASELVVSLLEAKPKLELNNNKYGTPLHCGVISGSVDVVLTLIEAGASLDAADRMGNTAVHVAARLGRHQILRILMRSGADTTLQNIRGRDARSIASDERRRATTGILLILDTNVGTGSEKKPSHPKPVGDGEVTDGRAQQPIGEGGDFIWTKEEVMARDGGEDTDSLSGFASEQGDSDGHQDDGPGKDASRTYETVMAAVHNTLQSNPLNPSGALLIDTSFADCLVDSSLAFVESNIWQPDLAGRATFMMAQTANCLGYALLGSFIMDLWSFGRLVDLDCNEEDCPPSGARTDDQKAFTLIMGMMISHMAHLAVSTKPREIWPGRGQQEVAHMIRWEARRLAYQSPSADETAREIKPFFQPPQRQQSHSAKPKPSSKYSEWKSRNAERDAETELGQQEDTIQSREVGANGDLNKLIASDESMYFVLRPPEPTPLIAMPIQSPPSFLDRYPFPDEPTHSTGLGRKGELSRY
jgi:ankyrin repeat protein